MWVSRCVFSAPSSTTKGDQGPSGPVHPINHLGEVIDYYGPNDLEGRSHFAGIEGQLSGQENPLLHLLGVAHRVVHQRDLGGNLRGNIGVVRQRFDRRRLVVMDGPRADCLSVECELSRHVWAPLRNHNGV